MIHYRRYIILPLLFSILTMSAALQAHAVINQPITITLPATTLHKTISGMLPLPLEQNGEKFQGTITVDSISTFEIFEDLISLKGQVSGRDMQLTTNIGGQDIQLKLGELVLPITCTISLRYDPGKKTLFLTPRFQNPTHGNSNSAKTLLPLLNSLANKEYPVTLDKINPINAKIGSQTVSLQMEPVDIKAANNEMILKLIPTERKSH